MKHTHVDGKGACRKFSAAGVPDLTTSPITRCGPGARPAGGVAIPQRSRTPAVLSLCPSSSGASKIYGAPGFSAFLLDRALVRYLTGEDIGRLQIRYEERTAAGVNTRLRVRAVDVHLWSGCVEKHGRTLYRTRLKCWASYEVLQCCSRSELCPSCMRNDKEKRKQYYQDTYYSQRASSCHWKLAYLHYTKFIFSSSTNHSGL